jgi:hypothetical protein
MTMAPLYIFLCVAAVYFVVAYDLVSSMAKYPRPRAQWPEKGDNTNEENSANLRSAMRSADTRSGRRMHDHDEQKPNLLAVGESPLDREHKPGVPVKESPTRDTTKGTQ